VGGWGDAIQQVAWRFLVPAGIHTSGESNSKVIVEKLGQLE
jgi:hypothetical protein